MSRNYAEIEWVTPRWLFTLFRYRVGVIRVWDMEHEPGVINKNPYSWACTVIHKSKNILEFKGVVKPPTPFHFRQIIRELQRHKYKTGMWVRFTNKDKDRLVEFTPHK